MTSAARKILDEALALPEREREALVTALSDSLSPEASTLGPEWTAEIGQRLEALERGEVDLVEWEDVDARLRRHLIGG